jgi:hypothetical protein
MTPTIARRPTEVHVRIVRRGAVHVMVRLVSRIDRGTIVAMAWPSTDTVRSQKMIGLLMRCRVIHLLRIIDCQRIIVAELLVLALLPMRRNHDMLWVQRWRIRVDLAKVASFLLGVRCCSFIDSQVNLTGGFRVSVGVLPFPARRVPRAFIPIFWTTALGRRLQV